MALVRFPPGRPGHHISEDEQLGASSSFQATSTRTLSSLVQSCDHQWSIPELLGVEA